MNLNLVLRTDVINETEFVDGLSYLGCSYVRYHSNQMVRPEKSRTWIDSTTRTWNPGKIDTSLSYLPFHPEVAIISIPRWPRWMDVDEDSRLDDDKKTEYASLCAELVRVINRDMSKNIIYWETINELEGRYQSDIETLAAISNQCADSMRAADSSIRIVGGSFSQPWDETITRFIQYADFDVWAHHNYASGHTDCTSVSYFLSKIPGIVSGIHNVREKLDNKGKSNVAIWLTEHNLFWTWEADGQKLMRSITGGIWDAWLLTALMKDQTAEAAFAWHDADTRYGKIQYNWSTWNYDILTPSAHVYHLFNTYTHSDDYMYDFTRSGDSIISVTFFGNSSELNAMFINPATTPCTLLVGDSNWHADSLFVVDSSQMTATDVAGDTSFILYPLSVSLFLGQKIALHSTTSSHPHNHNSTGQFPRLVVTASRKDMAGRVFVTKGEKTFNLMGRNVVMPRTTVPLPGHKQ
ncbi:MAG: hypothetical protein GF350_08565 [Chitinivibrionales bacterium]|nr:hypothetical protein [Chitinivibrionales bacterium]